MRIADVCAFYTPAGGGVRTYVEAKLRTATRFGHEMIVIAPGERHEVIRRGPGAVLVTIPSPTARITMFQRFSAEKRPIPRSRVASGPSPSAESACRRSDKR